MSTSELERPTVVGAGVCARVRAAREVVAGAAVSGSAGLASLGVAELGELVTELAGLESAAHALRLAAGRRAEEVRAAEVAGETGTDAWLARLTGSDRDAMAGGLWLARRLEAGYPFVREAFAEGALNVTQARVIVTAADHAPAGIAEADRREAEALLVAKATGAASASGRPLSPGRLRAAARRMFAMLGEQVAQAHADAVLLDAEAHAAAETWMMLDDNGDGTWSGRFRVSEVHGRLLSSFLDRLSSPRRLSRDRAGEVVRDASLPSNTGHQGFNSTEARGQALCELLEHLPTEGWGGKNALTLVVTTTLEALRGGLGEAGLECGTAWSAGQVRRVACEAGIVPVVLGGSSVPLDLGRTRRLHTAAQRAALRLTYDSCGIAGCERPFSWTEIHHPEPWSAGGQTSLANAVPLCGWHHHRVHDGRWHLRPHALGEWTLHRRR